MVMLIVDGASNNLFCDDVALLHREKTVAMHPIFAFWCLRGANNPAWPGDNPIDNDGDKNLDENSDDHDDGNGNIVMMLRILIVL